MKIIHVDIGDTLDLVFKVKMVFSDNSADIPKEELKCAVEDFIKRFVKEMYCNGNH